MNSNAEIENYIQELLSEEPAEELEKNQDYTKEDWDRWEKEVIKAGEDFLRECE